MRHYETTIQQLKDQVLTAVARLAWNEKLDTNELLDIPEQIIPGPEAQTRCCIYKERAVVTSRIKMAMGGGGQHLVLEDLNCCFVMAHGSSSSDDERIEKCYDLLKICRLRQSNYNLSGPPRQAKKRRVFPETFWQGRKEPEGSVPLENYEIPPEKMTKIPPVFP